MIKGPISGKLVSSGISHVVFASVLLGEKRLKKLMIMILIIMNNRQNHLLVNEKRRCRDG